MSIEPVKNKWKSNITDRQRFVDTLNYRSVDRCFNMEFGYWKDNFKLWPVFYENGITSNDDADMLFNFDRKEVIKGKLWMHPIFDETVVSQTDKKQLVMTEYGVIAEVFKNRQTSFPHFVKSSVQTPDDWKRMKEERFDPLHPDRIADVELIKKLHPPDRDYPLGIHCGSLIGKVRDILTFEGLAYACADYPDMVEDMVETHCVLVEKYLDQVLLHIDFNFASGWEDICYKNGPIVSVDFFKKVVVPRYKRISNKLKAAGIDIWFTDCDGDVRPLIPYLLEGGQNCLFPFEVNACSHPLEVFNEYGKDIRIIGGVDKMCLIRGKEAIKEYLESIASLVENGGYIPCCDHRCPPDVTQENYLYYLDMKEKYFGMKA